MLEVIWFLCLYIIPPQAVPPAMESKQKQADKKLKYLRSCCALAIFFKAKKRIQQRKM